MVGGNHKTWGVCSPNRRVIQTISLCPPRPHVTPSHGSFLTVHSSGRSSLNNTARSTEQFLGNRRFTQVWQQGTWYYCQVYRTLFWEAHFLYDFVNQKQNLLWKTWTQECHALHDFQRKDSFSSPSLKKICSWPGFFQQCFSVFFGIYSFTRRSSFFVLYSKEKSVWFLFKTASNFLLQGDLCEVTIVILLWRIEKCLNRCYGGLKKLVFRLIELLLNLEKN